MIDGLLRFPDARGDMNAVTITSAATVWDPGAGNYLRLMGGSFSVSVAGSVVFTEETSGRVVWRTPALLADTPYNFDLANGDKLAVAGKKLKAAGASGAAITGTLYGQVTSS